MNTREVIDALYQKHRSYYRVAQVLDVTDPAVYLLRDGKSIMSNKVARRAAEDLGIPFELLVCEAEIERAERVGDQAEAKEWRRRAEVARQRAAAVVLAIIAASTFHAGDSSASSMPDSLKLTNYLKGGLEAVDLSINYTKYAARTILRIAVAIARSLGTLTPPLALNAPEQGLRCL